MTFTVLYLLLIVVIPLLTLPVKSFSAGWTFFRETIADPRVVASYQLTLGTSLAAALVNGVLGAIVAWVLVRYSFPGRRRSPASLSRVSTRRPAGWAGTSNRTACRRCSARSASRSR
jgi:ABC-type sulfate transport system permease subunit